MGESDRYSGRRLLRYAGAVGMAGTLLLLTLGVVPSSSTVLRTVFDLDGGRLDDVRAGLVGLAPNPLAVALRRYAHGRLIRFDRTGAIAHATGVRVVGTAVLAVAGVGLFPRHGALVGGLALSAGAFSEAAWLALATRGLSQPQPEAEPPLTSLVRRHLDMSMAWLFNMIPMALATVGIAHSARPAASLVVWPALYELAALFFAPTADWESVVGAALRRDRRGQGPLRLTVWLSLAFVGAFAIVLVTPFLGPLYMRELLALPSGLADFGMRWAPLLLPAPALWLLRGHMRGRRMAAGDTKCFLTAGMAHATLLALTAAALSLTSLPGVAVGIVAVLAGLTADTAVVGLRTQLSPAPAPTPVAAG